MERQLGGGGRRKEEEEGGRRRRRLYFACKNGTCIFINGERCNFPAGTNPNIFSSTDSHEEATMRQKGKRSAV